MTLPAYGCPCGVGDKPCPGPDGKPLCAIEELPDWDKPIHCHCNTIAQARGCYERCDDWLTDRQRPSIMNTRGARDIIIGGIIAIVFSLALWVFVDLLPHAITGISQ